MKKLIIGLVCGIVATLGAVGTLSSVFAVGAETNTAQPEATNLESTNQDTAKPSEEAKPEIPPTFATTLDDNQRLVNFKLGHGLILAGNNITSETENKTGLMLVAGNNLALRTSAEYGFLLGNTISFAGESTRDLYIAGNSVTITHDAKIGRDVFVAANTLNINTNIPGDLAVTADTLVLKDVKISGNLNLDVAHVQFVGQVEIIGTLTYNDSADVSGFEQVKYGSLDAYHITEIDPATAAIARVYGEAFSIIALFLAMALICAFYPKLHDKIESESTVGRFGSNLAIGLGFLIAVPILVIFAFLTLIAAPLGIIALALYLVAIYLAQGFAGVWLGHVIIEKLCKAKGNIFVEAIIGITLLGLCSLIPYVGVATGFLGLLLGLGLIFNCIKPCKKPATQPKE